MKRPPNDHYYQFSTHGFRDFRAGAQYTRRWIESVDLSGFRLAGSNFRESHLREIDFSDADLTGACFAQAKLSDVRFKGANLRDATFADAELSDVDFSGAVLQGTDLERAIMQRNVHVDNPRRWTRLTLSADGKLLAWFEECKQQIWLWELFASEQGQVLATPSAPVYALFFHPLTHLLISIHDDAHLLFWDADARQQLHELQLERRLAENVRFSPDGRWLALPGLREKPHPIVWDLAQMRVKWELSTSPCELFAFSPQSTLLALGHKEAVEIWDLDSGALQQRIPLQGARELTFQASGQSLFVLTERLYQIETATGAFLDPRPDEHPGHSRPVTQAVFRPDSHLLATCDERTVQVWEVASGKHLFACDGYRAQFSPDSSWLAVYTREGFLQGWDCATWSLIRTFQIGISLDTLLFSPDGQLLLCFSGERSVYSFTVWPEYEATMEYDHYRGHFALYQSTSGTPVWPELEKQAQMHGPAIWRASFSPDSHYLTVFSEDDIADRGSLQWCWDLTTGVLEHVKPSSISEYQRQSLDYRPPVSSPDGRYQVLRTEGRRYVQIWDSQRRQVIETKEPPCPQTIYPAWHDQQVVLGQISTRETWQDLLQCVPPSPSDNADQEQLLIARKLAFEYCQALPPRTLPRGSRQDASWNSIQERTPQANTPVIAAVHKDGTLSVFHTESGQYQQMYDDPLRLGTTSE